LSTEQENQRRKLAQSFTVAGMHLGMGYTKAKHAVTGHLTTIDEHDKPFRLKEADYINKEYAFYDRRYASLKPGFYAYYGKHNEVLSNGLERTYDRVKIRADFVPVMVWQDEQPLYLYKVTQIMCLQTDEEARRIVTDTINTYGQPDNITETGPNRLTRHIDSVGNRGRDRHYIWRLNSSGVTRFDGNTGYTKNGMTFYDDLVLTLTHKDIKNWYPSQCDEYAARSKLELSLVDELYTARSLHLHNAYVEAGFPSID